MSFHGLLQLKHFECNLTSTRLNVGPDVEASISACNANVPKLSRKCPNPVTRMFQSTMSQESTMSHMIDEIQSTA
jgi:hypothetical protein